MKHNVLTTLLVGLLIVVGVSQVWAQTAGRWTFVEGKTDCRFGNETGNRPDSICYGYDSYTAKTKLNGAKFKDEDNFNATANGNTMTFAPWNGEFKNPTYVEYGGWANYYACQMYMAILKITETIPACTQKVITTKMATDAHAKAYYGMQGIKLATNLVYTTESLDSLKRISVPYCKANCCASSYFSRIKAWNEDSSPYTIQCGDIISNNELVMNFDNRLNTKDTVITRYLLFAFSTDFDGNDIIKTYSQYGTFAWIDGYKASLMDDKGFTSCKLSNYTPTTVYDYTKPVYYHANKDDATESILQIAFNGDAVQTCSFDYPKHVCVKWNTQADGSGTDYLPGAAITVSESDHARLDLYAQWEDASTITFNTHGGECDTETKTYKAGVAYGWLPSATRAGYTLNGWYTEETGGTLITTESIVPNDDAILHAHWDANTYTVSFNPQGGTCATPSKSVTFAQAYGDLPTPTATNHTFAGWYTEPMGSTKVDASTAVNIPNNHTLYAHWSGSITVNFNANGGTCATASKSVTMAAPYGELPVATRTDSVLVGWFTDPVGGEEVTASTQVPGETTHTLYAHWFRYLQTDANALKVYERSYGTSSIVGGINAKWVDTDVLVSAEERGLAAGESATMKFARAYIKDTTHYDIMVKVTAQSAIAACTWTGSTGGLNIHPNMDGATPWIDYEFWLELNGVTVKNINFSVVANNLGDGHFVRIYGSENVIFYSHDTEKPEKYLDSHTDIPCTYDGTEQAWTHASEKEIPHYLGTVGLSYNGHDKVSYKRTTGSGFVSYNLLCQTKYENWELVAMKTHYRTNETATALSFDDLNGQNPGGNFELYGSNFCSTSWQDHIPGFVSKCNAIPIYQRMTIYSLYKQTRTVPAYTKIKYHWRAGILLWFFGDDFYEQSQITWYYFTDKSRASIYHFQSRDSACQTAVDATYNGENQTAGKSNGLVRINLDNTLELWNGGYTGSNSVDYWFDNSQGSEAKDIDIWMLMTSVAKSDGNTNSSLFQSRIKKDDDGGMGLWIYRTTILNFDANGGEGTMTPQVIDCQIDDKGKGSATATIKANEFTYSGYVFTGWNTEADGSGTAYAPGAQYKASEQTTGEHILYAQWAPSITVNFDGQGGTPSFANKVVYTSGTYGELPTVTNGDLYFDGWFTDATAGDKVTSTTVVTATSEHTLYAHWCPYYTCTFVVNGEGGSVSPTSKPVVYNHPYDVLPTPTRPGYTFNKWWTDAEGGTEVTAATLVPVEANHFIYAHWTAKQYSVTFDKNGGQTVSPANKNVTYDAAYGTLATATHATHTFAGWWTAQNGGNQVTAETIVKTADAHTLWAHWYIPEVTDGTGMDSTSAKKAANDSLTSWAAKSTGSNTINVVIKRTIYKDGYFNTLCVPFDLTAAQITQTFGTYKELKEYLSCSVQGTGDDRELVIETQDATTIEAGKAYLISFANGTNLTELLFQGVQVTKTIPAVAETFGEASYQGILAPKVLPYGDEDYLFLGEENRLYWPKNDGTFLRGFRAYFKVETSQEPQAPVKRGMKASFGRTVPTSNDNVNVNDNNEIKKLIEEGRVVIKTNGVKYDMNGRKIVD